ncbi:MAG TPA: hypothetical protein VGL47_32935 [Amycolatopsis sp.]
MILHDSSAESASGAANLQENATRVETPSGHLGADFMARGQIVCGGSRPALLQEARARKVKASGKPVGFLLFLGVAGEKVVAADALDRFG